MKSWDLQVCDRASTITHVDRVKKSNSRSRRDVMRLSNKRSPYLFGVATANRTKVTTPNKYGAEIIARMSDWENPWYNKIWLCLNVTIWSSQICFSVIFIHFVMIKTSEKNCTYSHFFQSPVIISASPIQIWLTYAPGSLDWSRCQSDTNFRSGRAENTVVNNELLKVTFSILTKITCVSVKSSCRFITVHPKKVYLTWIEKTFLNLY